MSSKVKCNKAPETNLNSWNITQMWKLYKVNRSEAHLQVQEKDKQKMRHYATDKEPLIGNADDYGDDTE